MRLSSFLSCAIAAAWLSCTSPAIAFQGAVSPARFELRAQPGDVIREVLEVINDSAAADEYEFRSADWTLTPEGGVQFFEALQPDSCRTWLKLERHIAAFPPKKQKRFRFEIHVPPDALAGQCRFAIMIGKSARDLPNALAGNIRFPVQGRIGVLVYLTIGDAAPRFLVKDISLMRQGERLIPGITIHNEGTAHGRAEGVLEGTDATGKSIDFDVSSFPVLPGETRRILINPQLPDNVTYVLPLHLRGTIEWRGGKYEVDKVFE